MVRRPFPSPIISKARLRISCRGSGGRSALQGGLSDPPPLSRRLPAVRPAQLPAPRRLRPPQRRGPAPGSAGSAGRRRRRERGEERPGPPGPRPDAGHTVRAPRPAAAPRREPGHQCSAASPPRGRPAARLPPLLGHGHQGALAERGSESRSRAIGTLPKETRRWEAAAEQRDSISPTPWPQQEFSGTQRQPHPGPHTLPSSRRLPWAPSKPPRVEEPTKNRYWGVGLSRLTKRSFLKFRIPSLLAVIYPRLLIVKP